MQRMTSNQGAVLTSCMPRKMAMRKPSHNNKFNGFLLLSQHARFMAAALSRLAPAQPRG